MIDNIALNDLVGKQLSNSWGGMLVGIVAAGILTIVLLCIISFFAMRKTT